MIDASTGSRPGLLRPVVVAHLRRGLPHISDRVVAEVVAGVPDYSTALTGPTRAKIGDAVRLALASLLAMVSTHRATGPGSAGRPAIDAAFRLGRDEARSGRSTDALLSAFRVGARASWRELSHLALDRGVPPQELATFAEVVFAYIDELSAAAVAGHAAERTGTGRAGRHLLERLGRLLLERAAATTVHRAAERAGWPHPTTLTAVILPEDEAWVAGGSLPPHTLVLNAGDHDGPPDTATLLVPDVHGPLRERLLGSLADRGGVAGPARPWLEVADSLDRAVRTRALGGVDADEHLLDLVVSADPAALQELRTRVLAPLDDLGPVAAEKLIATLRSWLVHHGRRDRVAADLFIHPQTVRYRLDQLRALFGDSLDDPRTIVSLTVALSRST